jgi:hypothetical protein
MGRADQYPSERRPAQAWSPGRSEPVGKLWGASAWLQTPSQTSTARMGRRCGTRQNSATPPRYSHPGWLMRRCYGIVAGLRFGVARADFRKLSVIGTQHSLPDPGPRTVSPRDSTRPAECTSAIGEALSDHHQVSCGDPVPPGPTLRKSDPTGQGILFQRPAENSGSRAFPTTRRECLALTWRAGLASGKERERPRPRAPTQSGGRTLSPLSGWTLLDSLGPVSKDAPSCVAD